jgi:hypothetical protein
MPAEEDGAAEDEDAHRERVTERRRVRVSEGE